MLAVRGPGIVAEPAEARDAFSEFFGDGRREPGVDVFETALPCVAFGGGVEREEPLPALAGRAGARIEQQIGFRGQSQEGRAEDFSLRRIGSAGVAVVARRGMARAAACLP